jgi:hypothetical protein
MLAFDIVATNCISSDEVRRAKWIDVIQRWNLVIASAWRREDFNEGAIGDCWKTHDTWGFERWCRFTAHVVFIVNL